MNYIAIIIEKLKELRKCSPDLSFGDFIYSILRDDIVCVKTNKQGISWIREITDKEFYDALNRLLQEEKDYGKEVKSTN